MFVKFHLSNVFIWYRNINLNTFISQTFSSPDRETSTVCPEDCQFPCVVLQEKARSAEIPHLEPSLRFDQFLGSLLKRMVSLQRLWKLGFHEANEKSFFENVIKKRSVFLQWRAVAIVVHSQKKTSAVTSSSFGISNKVKVFLLDRTMRKVVNGCIISCQLWLAQLYVAAILQSLISPLSPTGGGNELGHHLWTSSSLWMVTLTNSGHRASGCWIYCSRSLQGFS